MQQERLSNEDFLSHIGILGMKWGRRKGDTSGSSSSGAQEDHSSEDHKSSRALKTKKMREMSNKELKELTTRLQLEKQYKDLKKGDISAGQKFVTDVLLSSAKQTATNYVAKLMGKGLDVAIAKLSKGKLV